MTADNQLFGYELPFPRQDLYVALIAVLAFIPAVVLLNALVRCGLERGLQLFAC